MLIKRIFVVAGFSLALLCTDVASVYAAVPQSSVSVPADSLATPKQAAAYYLHHPELRDTLRLLIHAQYLSRQHLMGYMELRTLRRSLWYTDLKDSVTQTYLMARQKMLPQIDASVDSANTCELTLLAQERTRCKEAFRDFICQSILQSVKGLSSGFLPSDDLGMQSSYQGICAATLPLTDLKVTIVKFVNETVNIINDQRRDYVNQLAGYAVAGGNYKISGFKYVVRRNPVDCPMEGLKSLNGVKNSIDWFHLGVSPASLFTPDLGKRLLAGGVALTEADAAKSKGMKILTPIINQIASATAVNIQQSVYTSVDQVFDQLVAKTQSTQSAFRELVHQKY